MPGVRAALSYAPRPEVTREQRDAGADLDRVVIRDEQQLKATREALAESETALDALRRRVEPKNPELFRSMAQDYVELIDQMRTEIDGYLGVDNIREACGPREMPERIYLHDETDDGDASLLELLWVQHRLEPGDTEYVRADLLTAALKQRDRAVAEISAAFHEAYKSDADQDGVQLKWHHEDYLRLCNLLDKR